MPFLHVLLGGNVYLFVIFVPSLSDFSLFCTSIYRILPPSLVWVSARYTGKLLENALRGPYFWESWGSGYQMMHILTFNTNSESVAAEIRGGGADEKNTKHSGQHMQGC